MSLADTVQRGWDAFGAGDFDALVEDYTEDMTLTMPGQTDILKGRQTFRAALDAIDQALPPGFEVTGLCQMEGGNDVISVVEWKSEKVADSRLCILFKFRGDKICEERWFADTEQWKGAF